MNENNLTPPETQPEPIKCELWSVGTYNTSYFGVRIGQPTESRIGITLTNLERGIALMNLLDQEEKSRGYILKKEGYRADTLASSPKALIERASIGDIKLAVQQVVTTKIEALNALQNIFPVECSAGGAQVFIEKTTVNPQQTMNAGNFNPQSYLSCFFLAPEVPKRTINLRYYKTGSGKCQYQYFANDLSQIFGQSIATSIADHRKLLKACVNKYTEVLHTIEQILVITPDEINTINSQFGLPVIQ